MEASAENGTAAPKQQYLFMNANSAKLFVPKWPHVAQVQQWLIQLGKNLVSVSNFNDRAEISWLQECKVKTFEQLANSGGDRFAKLDLKMATEFNAQYTNVTDAVRLMAEIQILDEEVSNRGDMLMGRQWVKLILDHFETDRHLDRIWQIGNLYNLEYPGDAKMAEFRFFCGTRSCTASRAR